MQLRMSMVYLPSKSWQETEMSHVLADGECGLPMRRFDAD